MHDIDPDTYAEAREALESQREAYGRYVEIVSAQSKAVEAENVHLMNGLADQLDAIITEIEEIGRRLAPAYTLVADSRMVGPNAQALRDLMTAVTADAALAQAAVRKLTQRLVKRRDETRSELAALDSASHSTVAGNEWGKRPSHLIDTRR